MLLLGFSLDKMHPQPSSGLRRRMSRARLQRDNQDASACCLTRSCSRAMMALPHLNVPYADPPYWSIPWLKGRDVA